MSRTTDKARPLSRRVFDIAWAEVSQLRPGLHTLSLVTRLMPPQLAATFRVVALQKLGFQIGQGTRIAGTPKFQTGSERMTEMLCIGRDCAIDVDVTLDLGERITIGDRVTIGHQVMILTSSHELGPREHRAGPMVRTPVTIESGAWLGARCIVLPGVTVGEGAVVAAGSLVNKDVAPNTRVSGVPAKGNEKLEP